MQKNLPHYSCDLQFQMVIVRFLFTLKKNVMELRPKITLYRFGNYWNKIQQNHRKAVARLWSKTGKTKTKLSKKIKKNKKQTCTTYNTVRIEKRKWKLIKTKKVGLSYSIYVPPFFLIWKIEGAEPAINFLFNSYLFPPVYSRLDILEIRIV